MQKLKRWINSWCNVFNMKQKTGKIFFFSGPSGVGKGTLINYLRKKHADWVFPPSCTTRKPRPGEVDGKTYFFISKEAFQERIKNGDFLEYAQVHGGHYYGTLKKLLLDPVKEGKTVIREFDVQGFQAAQKMLPKETYTSIFIRPHEGMDVLIERIKARAPITESELTHRMESMKKELALANIYDYRIDSVDKQLGQLFADVETLIIQEKNS